MKKTKERLDLRLQGETGLSRKKVKQLLDAGRVLVNGRKVVIASWEVAPTDRVEVAAETPKGHPAVGRYFLKVLFEDAHLLVVEKEAGVPCEPSPLATEPTMIEIINQYLKRTSPHLRLPYLAPVHRLDRETSGVMVYSRSKEANRLVEQFKSHSIKRKYLAVVEGAVRNESGQVEGFLQKSDLLRGGRKVKTSTPASGRKAVTRYRVVERYGQATLVEVTLNTGRTHQIRVQMASIGHPVAGDRIYGKAAGLKFRRQALHASFLGFRHPVTGQKMEFVSELPRDLRRLVDRLRVGS